MLAGQVVGRRTDEAVHLGPWHIPMLSTLWSTRCGLTAKDGPWYVEDDYANVQWCGGCMAQAGLTRFVGRKPDAEQGDEGDRAAAGA